MSLGPGFSEIASIRDGRFTCLELAVLHSIISWEMTTNSRDIAGNRKLSACIAAFFVVAVLASEATFPYRDHDIPRPR